MEHFLLTHILGQFAACGNFFGLPSWHEYINGGGCGDIIVPPDKIIGLIPLIGLAVLDMLLRIAGVVSVAFVIVGGVKYLTSQGSPDATQSAQKTIINALVGLVITIISVNVVSFIGHNILGG